MIRPRKRLMMMRRGRGLDQEKPTQPPIGRPRTNTNPSFLRIVLFLWGSLRMVILKWTENKPKCLVWSGTADSVKKGKFIHKLLEHNLFKNKKAMQDYNRSLKAMLGCTWPHIAMKRLCHFELTIFCLIGAIFIRENFLLLFFCNIFCSIWSKFCSQTFFLLCSKFCLWTYFVPFLEHFFNLIPRQE